MSKKSLVLLSIILILAAAFLIFYWQDIRLLSDNANLSNNISTIDETEKIIKQNPNISVRSPQPNNTVGKKINLSGQAKGTWYFEASFPVIVKDLNGNQLAQTVATALGDWMTEDFVPFSTTITLATNYSGPALLILKKDNPSGEPQFDDQIEIPINIAQ